MKVAVHNPQVELTLYKTIKRTNLGDGVPASTRFQETNARVDLTPYLGEGSAIRTTKSVRGPAGAFSLALSDKPFMGYIDSPQLGQRQISAESLYGILEPMDVIEIRFRHEADASTDRPPIVMRGFVSGIRRGESMSQDGKPVRVVNVTGQDYGKLWQMLQILYLPGYVVGQDTLTAFKLFERFGVGLATSLKAGDFVREVVEKIINPYLRNLMPPDVDAVRELKLDEDQLVKHGTTSISGPQNKEGTIFDLLRTFGDVGIWNELFLEDREDGVYCVYRPNPFKNVDGTKIVPDSADAVVVDVPDSDLVAMDVSRSDENIANYYWVRSPRFEMATDIYRRQYAVATPDKETVLLGDHPNCSEKLYGIRVMFVDTEMGGDDVTTFNGGLPEADKVARDTQQANWLLYRRRALVDQNKDNVLLESGSFRLKGNEKLRPGCYLKLQRGTFEAEYYMTQVSHDYIPYQGFFTGVQVERGTGFIERAKREGGAASPYFAEMTR